MNKSLFIFSAALFSAFAFAVPLRFDAPADSTKTFQASAYHGETLEIEAQLTWRNAPLAIQGDAEAAMCWQTNGMGDAWWTAPASVTTGGVVTATWSPSNDVGAASYRVFFRVAGPGGASYRANMLLRLLGSPGATPNSLQLPVPLLDFARITVTNEPWSVVSGLTTNDVRGIIESDAGPTNRIVRFDAVGTVTLPGFLNVGDDIILRRGTPGAVLTSDAQTGNANLGGTTWLYSPDFSFDDPGREIAVKDDLAPLARTDSLGTAAYRDASEFATATDEALVYQLLTNRLSGVTFDFATVAGLYIAISNIVAAQGGTITNFPVIP